jgi:NAD(P)-dependent dehydrogenase (short-subunit alcohol dehydrogenase family)
MPRLKNKIAVVTGGSSGIGLATAKKFVEEGAYVFIAGRRQSELDKAVAEIGKNVTGVKTDISKLDDLDHLFINPELTSLASLILIFLPPSSPSDSRRFPPR